MARVKNSVNTRKKRKKVLKEAKGYFGSKHRLWKTANEQLMVGGNYAYRDRKAKKRDFRKLWIQRINAAARNHDMSYSTFINGLKKAGVELDRKMLSEIAIHDEEQFKKLVDISKKALNGEVKKTTAEAKEAKVVKKEEKTTKKEEKAEDLSKKTLAELKELAKAKGLKGYSTLKKDELIKLIEK